MSTATSIWSKIEAFLAVVLLALALMQVGQMMGAMVSTSLSTDEFGTIGTFSGKGPVRVTTDYRAPKNHIFFNLLNSVLPGRESFNPARARVLSILATAAIPVILILVALTWHRWIEAALVASPWAFAPKMLELSMEARGYGFLALFALIASIAVCRYFITCHRAWIILTGVAVVLGTYTVPTFIAFGAPLLILSAVATRRRDCLVVGAASAAAIVILYLPVVSQMIAALQRVSGAAENDFVHWTGLIRGTKLYLFSASDRVSAIVLAGLLATPFIIFAFRRASEILRAYVVVTGSVAIALTLFLILETPPVRTMAFLLLPLAFAGIFAIGELLREKRFLPWRALAVVAAVVVLLGNSAAALRALPFTPAEDWTRAAKLIDLAFPKDTPVDYGRFAKYLKHTFASPDRPSAPYSDADFATGKLVVVDAANKWADDQKFEAPLTPGVLTATVPGTIRDIRAMFVLPNSIARPAAPASLVDFSPETGIPAADVNLSAAPGETVVVLLDRPVHPRTIRPTVGVRSDIPPQEAQNESEAAPPKPFHIGNMIIYPASDSPADLRITTFEPTLRAVEVWIVSD